MMGIQHLIVFAILVLQCSALVEMNFKDTVKNSTDIIPEIYDDNIYKCVSYTGAHIDISHWIMENFTDYKDCQRPGLYTLNRKDRYFKVDIDVQRSWIVEVSAIIFNGTIRPICGLNSFQFSIRPTDSCETNGINVTITETDRFETLSLYHDMGNLTIITTHNKQDEPLHFNINIWQVHSDISGSYGLCSGSTCSSEPERNFRIDQQKSSYPVDIIVVICNIYIDNYLNSTGRQAWERSIHYNRTIENVHKACVSDVQITDSPYAAAGSLEVLFVEDQVNLENITTMSDIHRNYHINLEDKLLKLAETIDLSRAEVEDFLIKLTTTTTTSTTSTTMISVSTTTAEMSTSDATTKQPTNDKLYIIVGSSIGGVVLLVGLTFIIYCCMKKTKLRQLSNRKVTDSSFHMKQIEH